MNGSGRIENYGLSQFSIAKIHHDKFTVAGSPPDGFHNPCFGYILAGRGVFFHETIRLSLSPGDAVFIPKGQKYTSHWFAEPEVCFYSLNFSFVNESQTRSLFSFESLPLPRLRPSFDALYESSLHANALRTLSCFYTLLEALSESFHPYNGASMHPIQPALDYIETHLTQPIHPAQLARLCCISESGFYAKFRAATGMSPIEYCNKVRIRRAMALLNGSDATIEQISDQLGFSSPSYFRRVFRKTMGESPKTARRRFPSP